MSSENLKINTPFELTEQLFKIVNDPAIRSIIFGVPYDAEVGYRDTYNGQAIKQLTSVSNRNGEIVFEV